MANRKNALFNCTTGWTGVQPGMKFEYIPPMGTGKVSDWTGANPPWNEDDVVEYLKAYYAVLAAPLQQEYLRIPGAAEYWHDLDINVSAVLAGQMQPKAALDATAAAWEKVTERYGRDKQKALYKASFE
jgi:multiple sugar transport system substrate-binding protein